MRIVVTGGLGFIGTRVIERLLDLQHEVICVDYVRDLIRMYETNQIPVLSKVYRNLRDCRDVLEPDQFLHSDVKMDACIHLGACVDTRELGPEVFQKNLDYTRALADTLPYNTRVVYASSAAVYGTEGFPCNPYGLTKKLGETILGSSPGLAVCSLRFFNVFGANEHHKGDMASVPFKIARTYKTRGRFSMFCPDASRDFVSVEQVVDCVVGHTLRDAKEVGPTTWDVGRGESVTFGDLDYMLRVINGRQESCCDMVEMLPQYNGRYQFFTKAGSKADISPYIKEVDLRDLLSKEFHAEN